MPVSFEDIKQAIDDKFFLNVDPQNNTLASQGWQAVKEGLAQLSKFGFFYQLEKFDPSSVIEVYPKMVYRDGDSVNAPKTMEVDSTKELELAKEAGWWEHPTERPAPAAKATEPAPAPAAEPEHESVGFEPTEHEAEHEELDYKS